LESNSKPFNADVAIDELLTKLFGPVAHFLLEQAAVELD
jgi:hypothetical protein